MPFTPGLHSTETSALNHRSLKWDSYRPAVTGLLKEAGLGAKDEPATAKVVSALTSLQPSGATAQPRGQVPPKIRPGRFYESKAGVVLDEIDLLVISPGVLEYYC